MARHGGGVLFSLAWPTAVPEFVSGLKTGAPLAVIGAIVAEFFVANGSGLIGLGTLMTAYRMQIPNRHVDRGGLGGGAVGRCDVRHGGPWQPLVGGALDDRRGVVRGDAAQCAAMKPDEPKDRDPSGMACVRDEQPPTPRPSSAAFQRRTELRRRLRAQSQTQGQTQGQQGQTRGHQSILVTDPGRRSVPDRLHRRLVLVVGRCGRRECVR